MGQIYPFDNPDLQVRVGNVVDLKKQLQAKRIGHKPYIDKNGPCLSDHFVEAGVKSFGYDALEDAVAWAGNGAHPSSASIPMRDSLPASGV